MLSLIRLGHLSGEGHQVFEFAILTGELCARLDISLASAYTARRMLIGLVVHRGVRDVTALCE